MRPAMIVRRLSSREGLCKACAAEPSTTTHALLSRQHLAEEKLAAIHQLCSSCSGTPVHERNLCDSIDCPVLYARVQAHRDVEDLGEVRAVVERMKNIELDDAVDESGEGEFGHALDW